MPTQKLTLWSHLSLHPGTLSDYISLQHFHYRPTNPATITRIFIARYTGPGLGGHDATHGMTAGVIIESLPSLACTLRNIALLDAALLNRDLRTISRVIVHPIFRSAGLAVELVRHLLQHATTPYVEALAAMARVHPFFARAGMTPFDRPALPDAIRLLAALQQESLTPLDLTTPNQITPSPFLLNELRRFTKKNAPPHQLLTLASHRLLSQPLYHLWTHPTPPQRPPPPPPQTPNPKP